MPRDNTVHVVGPGTIGAPLASLASRGRSELGVDQVTVSKRTPRASDRPTVEALQGDGLQLAVREEDWDEFQAAGYAPDLTLEQALDAAAFVADCTPAGLDHKTDWYEPRADGSRTFVAQGSEEGFGVPHVLGVNDDVMDFQDEDFVHIVSCNTHNISALVDALGFEDGAPSLEEGRFVCIRRSSDVSDTRFQPAPSVGAHEDEFGSHHARDVNEVFQTRGHDLDLFSSAVKVPTQYMHAVWFSLKLDRDVTEDQVLSTLEDRPRVGFTEKQMANLVYSHGRNVGPWGRILAQTVVSRPTVSVRKGNEVVGFCFTPQDGNVLLTNLAAIARTVHPDDWEKRIAGFEDEVLEEY
jgi:glyceraldehyde-3-phosphate dehydrogenase (NAD(P))